MSQTSGSFSASKSNIFFCVKQREYRSLEPSRQFLRQYGKSLHHIHTMDVADDFIGHRGCVNTIAFNKEGDLLLTGSDDRSVKVWDFYSRKCLTTLFGHVSNVFAGVFLPYKNNQEIVSAGNDADIRHYDIIRKTCTVYRHHAKKILRVTVNPRGPTQFLTCSSDGTIRMFDVRQKYSNTTSHTFYGSDNDAPETQVLPQAFGGGRASAFESPMDSLLLNYSKDSKLFSRRNNDLFYVDFHPLDGNRFIVASAKGNVRLFDLRKIIDNDPGRSYINIYRNVPVHEPSDEPPPKSASFECTGAVFSKDGKEIVATALNDHIYVFDTETNYEKDWGLDYFSNPVIIKRPPKPEHSRIKRRKKKSCKTGDHKKVRKSLADDSMNTNSSTQESSSPQTDSEEFTTASTGSTEAEEYLTYKQQYKGHFSMSTIKGVNFYGPNSEFVMSGSDDAKIFIWDKKSGELLTILDDHESVVNCIIGHPHDPMIVSSGIDDVAKVWEPFGDYPTVDELRERKYTFNAIAQENIAEYDRERRFMHVTGDIPCNTQ